MLSLSRQNQQQQQQQQQEQLLSITMTSLLLRISIICHLFTAVLYFLPKKLRSLLHNSWKPNARQGNQSVDAQLPAPPAMNCCELNQVFRTFDRNGDGRISKEELNDSLENLGIFISDGDLTSMIRRIDADGDGCVDAEEFKALYQGIMEVRGQEQEEEDMREAFEVFDVNGDGYITVDELRSVLSLLGLKQGRTVEECRRMIGRVDGDGDGRVSFKEFREMMKGGGMEVEGQDF